MNRQVKRVPFFIFMALLASVILISCGPKAVKPIGEMDTPEHHFFTAMKFLDQANYVDANREFDRALQLAPKFSKAFAGKGLVGALQGDFVKAEEFLKNARSYAKTDDEKVFSYVSYIRFYTLKKGSKNWLDDAKDAYDDAIKIDPKSSDAYFFMGMSYRDAYVFEQSGQMFGKVIELKGDYVDKADTQWKMMQEIQRALPGTVVGKKIALQDRITRADAAALFMEEMKIDVLYKMHTQKKFDTSFKAPDSEKAEGPAAPALPPDVASHPLKADIEGVLKMGVRGLETYPDGNFHPDEIVDRATYALIIEDILIQVSGDNALATKFIGSTSPFPDLLSDLPYFNAVMVVTSRGIMEPKDITTGEFAPLGQVSGVDALLIIRKFKEELKIF
ncbi:MAG: hypothetical protein ABSB79_01135 [Syntrophales bacterium]|jgi:hypothetical protein